MGGNYNTRCQGVIHTFIALNVLLRSQLWVSAVLQEAGEKGKEGARTRHDGSVGLLKPGLEVPSGSHWARSLGQKRITDLKVWLVFRYRDVSCWPVPSWCQPEANRGWFDLQVVWCPSARGLMERICIPVTAACGQNWTKWKERSREQAHAAAW